MLQIDLEVLAADDSTFSHPPRNHGSVTRHAATRGENGACRDYSVEIFRSSFVANENHALSRMRPLLGCIRVEHCASARGTRTRRKAETKRRRPNRWVDYRMQQLIELPGWHSPHRFDFVDESFTHHVARNAHRRGGSAFTSARLQQEQLATLDREFEVLHVAVMLLEPLLSID